MLRIVSMLADDDEDGGDDGNDDDNNNDDGDTLDELNWLSNDNALSVKLADVPRTQPSNDVFMLTLRSAIRLQSAITTFDQSLAINIGH